MKKAFKERRFSVESYELIDKCNGLIGLYVGQGYTLTVRQLYYQMIARDLFPESWIDVSYNDRNELPVDTKNTDKNYKKFARLVSEARLSGWIDWDAIVDRARTTDENTHWNSIDDILSVTLKAWAIDKWHNQSYHIEAMCEKDAIAGILAPACGELDIPFTACRGYASQTILYERGKVFQQKWTNEEKVPVVLYFGDHDPSGLEWIEVYKIGCLCFLNMGMFMLRGLRLQLLK